jgi:Holliday junction resolvase-like predicted endonuclease
MKAFHHPFIESFEKEFAAMRLKLLNPRPAPASQKILTKVFSAPGLAARAAFGLWCEEAVAQYGECVLGWTVVARRVHFREGELDLVFRAPQGTLMFVEVKGRRGHRFGTGLEALLGAKRERFFRATLKYLALHHVREAWQMWGVAVHLESDQKAPTFEWAQME